jgi:hypothetical protein
VKAAVTLVAPNSVSHVTRARVNADKLNWWHKRHGLPFDELFWRPRPADGGALRPNTFFRRGPAGDEMKL